MWPWGLVQRHTRAVLVIAKKKKKKREREKITYNSSTVEKGTLHSFGTLM
jgi:hypothetical protein